VNGRWCVARPHALRLALFGLGLALAGCAAPVAKTSPTPAVTLEGLARFLPLENATVFSYATRVEPSGEQGLLVLEVRRPRADSAELVVAGRAQRLVVRPDAIELVTGGFLLKQPLTQGAEFRGDFGQVKLARTGIHAKVPAGEFDDCLETIESTDNQAVSRVTTTIYCPGVGIVSRRTEAESDEGSLLESMELRSFGKKFELPR
jgi:hypothetical protein